MMAHAAQPELPHLASGFGQATLTMRPKQTLDGLCACLGWVAGCSTVFVKNLPYDVSEEDVKAAFSVCGKVRTSGLYLGHACEAAGPSSACNGGPSMVSSFYGVWQIRSVRLAIWNHTKALKGFGYVDFVKEQSAEIAVKKQGAIQVGGGIPAGGGGSSPGFRLCIKHEPPQVAVARAATPISDAR
jgi:hypothetical protein